MDGQGVIPSQDAWQRVSNAVKRVEAGRTDYAGPVVPHLQYPAVVCKVTGPKSGDYYPGVILTWNSDTEAWEERDICYIRA